MALKRQSWHTINRRRNTLLRLWIPKFRNEYKRFGLSVKGQIDTYGLSDIEARINELSADNIRKVLIDFYIDVGVRFANATVNDAKGWNPDLNTKAFSDLGWVKMMQDFAETDVAELVASIVETPKTEAIRIIKNIVQEAAATGEGIIGASLFSDSVTNRIVRQFSSEWGKSANWMGRRIAQTEMIRASNFATKKSVDTLEIDYLKAWLVSSDGKERESHVIAADENTAVPKNEPFIVSGYACEYPGDASLPPEESVNCRCAFTAFPPDDL